MSWKLYPKLSEDDKKKFLNMVAISFTSPYALIKSLVDEQEYREKIAIKKLVLDYFLYSNEEDVKKLRTIVFDAVRNINGSHSSGLTSKDVLESLYQPEIIKLLFEQSMYKMSLECGIPRSDALDKSFKFRSAIHSCEADKKKASEKQAQSDSKCYSYEDSNNPVLPVLRHIVDSVYTEVMLEPEHVATSA